MTDTKPTEDAMEIRRRALRELTRLSEEFGLYCDPEFDLEEGEGEAEDE